MTMYRFVNENLETRYGTFRVKWLENRGGVVTYGIAKGLYVYIGIEGPYEVVPVNLAYKEKDYL